MSYISKQSMKSDQPISLDAIASRFPSVAQSLAHWDRSTKFQPVTTLDVVGGMVSEGFNVHAVQVAGLTERGKHRDGYQRHLLRMRRDGIVSGSEYAPELIIQNANDGSASFSIILGAFRFICENGIITGSSFGAATVSHRGDNIQGRVIDASYTVIGAASRLMDKVETWRGITLDRDTQEAFASEAHAIRFPGADRAPITSQTMLTTRRGEDAGSDLWSVFNRVQENTTRGGFRGRIMGNNGRMRNTTMRPINSIAANVSINRQLFDLAERFATAA